MIERDIDWVFCPVCDAGSPAGASICPVVATDSESKPAASHLSSI